MAATQFEEQGPASEVAPLVGDEPRSKPRRWAVALPLLGTVAALTLLATRSSGTPSKRTAASVRGAQILQEGDWGGDGGEGDSSEGDGEDEGGCAKPGGNCLSSKCCADGGAKGYQCYAKNDGWAECHGGCEKGPHEGETDGTYDEYGTFKPAEWSCKKLGERSKRDCFGFDNKKDCDKDRCVWGGGNGTDSCVRMCSLIGDAGECDGQSHCMWFEDKCQPGCGTEAECPEDRCVQGEDKKCLRACWAFFKKNECPKEQRCIWDDTCKDDPCSSPEESCLETKCCSAQRGGEGMTCFSKDKNYAQCKTGCWEDDWKCKALGNRTKLSPGCSWPGEDCSETGLCCQSGFTCAVKDDMFTGCTLTSEKHTWASKEVDIPGDWEGTIVGGSRDEYEVPQAGEGEEVAGTKLFCFMAYLPDSSEVGLKQVAEERNASIFGCDLSAVYESWNSGSAGWDTGESTITNTDVFLNVWNQVDEDGLWRQADWTVKVDPDAVIVAERLKWHLDALRPPAYRPIYIKNNGMDPGLGNDGFLGAVEIFSTAAVEIYMDNWEGCKVAFGLDTGEDGFFKGCMDALGVGWMLDVNIFKPDFSPGACANGDMVGFHPIKQPDQWRCCQDLIEGKNRKVDFGKCDMGDDGMGPEEEPPDYVMPGGR